jgi:tetratricopeptide (TPR) repeat protein
MSFFDTAARAKSYLREHGRISVGGLRREFDLDDEGLEQLVEELVDVQQVAVREGKVLSWVGVAAREAEAAGGAEPNPEATARPEFTPPWPARSNLTTVQLARLTKRQARDMIATLAGTELPPATLDALVARADGVPLYVEELTKSVAEPGTARDVEAIPATLADSLMGRLDRLSTAKEVAQRAAVLGREFGYPLLAATAGLDEAALQHGLARLVEAEILFARGEPPAATYTFKGNFSRALHHFEQSIKSYDPSEHGSLAYTVGFDSGVGAHLYAALCHAYLGLPDRALAVSEAAVALAKRVEHPLSLANALHFAGIVHFERGELDRMRERAGEVVVLAEQLGFPVYLGMGRVSRGRARVESGEGEAGVAEMQEAMVELARIGSRNGAPQGLFLLAAGLRKAGRHDDALAALGLGVAQAEQQGQHYYDAELHRLRAEILLDKDAAAAPGAEALFGRSLEIARRQEAKTFELRAATSLARLWQRQGKRDAARDLLAPLYAWFSEGFDTRDLKGAKALLAELG